MAQKYEWGWTSHFEDGGAPYEEGEGYASKAAVLQDVQKARAEEKKSLEEHFQNSDTVVKYKIRRRPAIVVPDWEEVPG